MNNQNKISIIIPCYNAGKTISKCLDSIISQNYQNMEIIIIDDGSYDESPSIIKNFLVKDSRIILYQQENLGVSKSRNKGIKMASGNYICFVDADDWVEKDHCQILYQTLTENNSDISITEALFEDEYNNHLNNEKKYDSTVSIYDKQTALILLLEDKIIQSHPWAKLYKSELLKKITFPENLDAFEDYYTMFQVFNMADKIAKINYATYHYVQFDNSLSHNLTPRRAYHFFIALMKAHIFLQTLSIESKAKNSVLRNILKKSFMVLKRIIRNTDSDAMLFEKENIKNSLQDFLIYTACEIGIENYLYLRFFIYYPERYSRFIK